MACTWHEQHPAFLSLAPELLEEFEDEYSLVDYELPLDDHHLWCPVALELDYEERRRALIALFSKAAASKLLPAEQAELLQTLSQHRDDIVGELLPRNKVSGAFHAILYISPPQLLDGGMT